MIKSIAIQPFCKRSKINSKEEADTLDYQVSAFFTLHDFCAFWCQGIIRSNSYSPASSISGSYPTDDSSSASVSIHSLSHSLRGCTQWWTEPILPRYFVLLWHCPWTYCSSFLWLLASDCVLPDCLQIIGMGSGYYYDVSISLRIGTFV